MVLESLLDVLHVGTAAGKYDAAQQFVVVIVGYLVPDVLDDFLQPAFDNLDKLATLHLTVLVDGQLERIVDIVVVGIGRGVFQFHLLGLALLHLQAGDVVGDVVAAQGYDGQVAQDVLGIDRDGSSVGTDVDQCAARTLFSLGEHAVGQRQGSEVELGHADACILEALVQLLEESLALEYVQVVTLQLCTLYAHGVELQLRVDAVFLDGSVEYFLVGVNLAAVGVLQFVDHGSCNGASLGQVLDDDVAHAADGLSTHTYIYLGNLRLELCLQFPHDVREALRSLVDVVNHSLADDRRGRVFLDDGQHADAAVEILHARDTRHLR